MSSLLERLDKVKQAGSDRWTAKCPGPLHRRGDRNPSLSVRLTEDRILVKCHAGCSTAEIVSALGLEMHDLLLDKPCSQCRETFSPKHPEHKLCAKCYSPGRSEARYGARSPIAPKNALRVLHYEVLLTAIAAENVANDITLTQDDRDRLILAARRIRNAVEVTL